MYKKIYIYTYMYKLNVFRKKQKRMHGAVRPYCDESSDCAEGEREEKKESESERASEKERK